MGDDPPSKVYLASKHKAAEELGIISENHTLPGFATEADVADLIDRLNADPSVNGILLQLPLPQHLDGRTNDRADLAEEGRRRPDLREHGSPHLRPGQPRPLHTRGG